MALSLTSFPPDLEPLLQPIPGENPVGEYLRYEGTYDAVQDARREDDPSLPQGVWQTALKRADWKDVARRCQKALAERTKDLQIAGWLCEAWLHLHGFVGMATGVRLLSGLCARFWPGIYPEIDGDDTTFRLSPIEWIDQKLVVQLKLVLITKPPAGSDLPASSYSDWQMALQREREAQANPPPPGQMFQEEQQASNPQQRFLSSASVTDPGFYRGLRGDLRDLSGALEELAKVVDEKLGEASGTLRQIRNLVHEIAVLVNQISGATAESDQASSEEHGGADDPAGQSAADAGHAGQDGHDGTAAPLTGGARGPIRNRAEAYQRLAEAAEFLARTEPHSPAPYLVKRAIAWGNLSLIELLGEIIQSPGDLTAIYSLLGIRRGGASE